jgi:hypothetical protein
MPDEHPTLNDELINDAASSAASTPDPIPSNMDDASIPDDKRGDSDLAQNEPNTPADDAAAAPDGADDKGDGAGKDDAKPAPFHEHPDWQRMVNERNEATEKATGLEQELQGLKNMVEKLQAMKAEPPQSQATGRDYDKELNDLNQQLNEGDISQSDHATKMVAILRAQYDEKLESENRGILEAMEKQQRAHQIESAFYRDNPDFDKMMLSGKIAEVKGTSPMHDDFSAYWAAKYNDAQAQMEERIEAARKEARDTTIKELKAGKNAASLDGSTVTKPKTPDDKQDVSKVNVRKVGGVNKFLADRLEASRARRQGG